MSLIDEVTPAEWNSVRNCKYDVVEKPAHYNTGEIEAIDYIKQQLGQNFSGYLEGNVLKYIHRWHYKNGIEDLRKAKWYLERLIKEEIKIES